MDKKNYEETDPEQYKMMDGTIITSGNPDMLLNAFRTTYFAQGDYISDTEANTMRQLIKRLSES